ncbi:MAG TPA: trypsin-like peptidase domain-containing protein [Kofleriaceae bacterium]
MLAGLYSGPAWADSATNVSFTSVDASTLRVFAVGTVGVATIQGHGFSVQVAEPQSGHGTGFAVERELILTANHVVDGARHVVVRLPGEGGFLPARVVFADKDADVAVLHVNASLTPIRMQTDNRSLRVRQTVYAVGYPLDPSRTQAQSSKGIVSGQLEDGQLQLDINLNPGNSGGPLVDEKDAVVGLVVARGDVAKGVQGIGMAVPVATLKTAVAEANKAIAGGNVRAVSTRDKMSAEVVDQLVRQGSLQSVKEADDFKKTFEHRDLDKRIDELARRIDDADLLVYVAGTLWNASLAVRYGGVRAIGTRTLSEPEAHTLARDLETTSIRLTKRGRELDATVGSRSSFVGVALGRESGLHTGAVVTAAYLPGSVVSVSGSARRSWSLSVFAAQRQNQEAGGGWGGSLDLRQTLTRGGFLFAWGVSAASVTLDSPQTISLRHSFVAFEAGMGVSFGLGRSRYLQFYGGIAPSYYSASAEDLMAMSTTQSDVVVDHFRATATLELGRWRLTSGLRLISSTTWLEPIGLGVSF